MASTTGYENDNVGAFISKDPGSTLDYVIQWSEWLSGDSISSVAYAITSEAESSPTLTTLATGFSKMLRFTRTIKTSDEVSTHTT